jgi:hypothetical protein
MPVLRGRPGVRTGRRTEALSLRTSVPRKSEAEASHSKCTTLKSGATRKRQGRESVVEEVPRDTVPLKVQATGPRSVGGRACAQGGALKRLVCGRRCIVKAKLKLRTPKAPL